jgi:hypothetical protein
MKIVDSFWLGQYIRENEEVQHYSLPLAPAWAVLNFQHLKVIKSLIWKDQTNKTLV